MKRMSFALAALMTLLAAPAVWAQGQQGQADAPRRAGLAVPVSAEIGTMSSSVEPEQATGSFEIQKFVVEGGQVLAKGVLVLQKESGGVIVAPAAAPLILPSSTAKSLTALTPSQATCDILNLVIGPIHLDLLGLVIDTNTITIDIVAESGPGNLLGNLLCALVGLFDGTGPLQQIANLLNQILSILSGLLG